MSDILRIFLVAGSLISFMYILHKIKKSKMQIEDSIVWILWSIIIFFVSIFPMPIIYISKILKIQSPANFVFLLVGFYLYYRIFSMSAKISELKEKNKDMVQKVSLLELKYDNMIKVLIEDKKL
ncbi:MAG TPA: DUF2304 domain-containing protein [Desulfosporosinus sp.]|nr:DUF2304 domain-containing protein [Desulfosporosinus sp.]